MAVRITHTNNSQGHDGTYVYRSTSPMDPQNLPAPIADEPPVALGATFEYIDAGATEQLDYYYRTRDYEGGQLGAVSEEVVMALAPDLSSAQVGDEIGGGVYAGQITYADNRQFHIVAALQSGEISTKWKTSRSATSGTDSNDDGMANTLAAEAAGLASHPAASHCLQYAGGGYNDWYFPSVNELGLLYDNLSGHPEFANSAGSSSYTWSSTQADSSSAKGRQFSGTGGTVWIFKDNTNFTRPVRRVAV